MGNGKSILIVEDSTSAQQFYLRLLEGLNAKIDTAGNGRDALKLALAVHYDLIITDVEMPKMNGLELCRRLQANPSTKDIPLIIISTFDSDVDVEIGFEAGASAYLSKSEAASNLYSVVNELLWKYDNVRQKKILVVEDSRTIAHFVAAGLMKHSFKATVAENGSMAKEMLPSLQPDLVLCDLKMPVMDGYALCKWMNKTESMKDIPFVAMSAAEEQAAVQRIIQYGAAAYVQKPFSMNQIIPLIDRLLSDHVRLILGERERLHAERAALVNSMTALVAALEAKDPNTRGHSEIVAEILVGVVRLHGSPQGDEDLIRIGGRLHDIGKIGIRDDILLKPGRLTDEEYNHIKTHPVIGRAILESIPSLKRILPIAYSHHERWDGKGYPEGLAGNDIPILARMVAVADMFDALINDRPYRRGMSVDAALRLIRDVRGTQLCPECVDVFFDYTKTDEFRNLFTKPKPSQA